VGLKTVASISYTLLELWRENTLNLSTAQMKIEIWGKFSEKTVKIVILGAFSANDSQSRHCQQRAR